MLSRASDAPQHPDLVVKRRPGDPKIRKFGVITGINPPLEILVHSDDINTLERAVKERVFFVKNDGEFSAPPRPRDDESFFQHLLPFREAIHRFLPKTAPMTASQFAGLYTGRKKKIYEDAVESLCRNALTEEDSHIKVFVKLEKTNFTAKPDAVPRVISPRDPRYNVEVGRYLRSVEERLYVAIAKVYGDKTVVKGVNALESARIIKGKWDHFDDPCAVGLDAKRFDQHVSQSALRWEHGVYVDSFRCKDHRRRLSRLLEMQLKNTCRGYCTDGKLKYTVEGGRMSGDMNTGLGNCLLMCAMIYSYSKHLGVEVKLANNGDDCVVFMEKRDLQRFMAEVDVYFLDLGFSMEVEKPVFEFEHIVFCQTQPVCSGVVGEYMMVRDPRVALAKDCVSSTWYPAPRQRLGWMDAVGMGGMAMCGGIPLFQEFYARLIKDGKFDRKITIVQSWGVRALGKDMVRSYSAITDATRASFYLAFGVTPEEQIETERFYKMSTIKLDDGIAVPPSLLPFFPY